MPQTTLTGKELPEDDFWEEGSFIESVSPEEMKQKERTIHMKHNEEMKYNCKQCNVRFLRITKTGTQECAINALIK